MHMCHDLPGPAEIFSFVSGRVPPPRRSMSSKNTRQNRSAFRSRLAIIRTFPLNENVFGRAPCRIPGPLTVTFTITQLLSRRPHPAAGAFGWRSPADLLSLALAAVHPGRIRRADIAIGSAQRFGRPASATGGPHAALFLRRGDEYKRQHCRARIVGVSRDSTGRPRPCRLSLQTRRAAYSAAKKATSQTSARPQAPPGQHGPRALRRFITGPGRPQENRPHGIHLLTGILCEGIGTALAAASLDRRRFFSTTIPRGTWEKKSRRGNNNQNPPGKRGASIFAPLMPHTPFPPCISFTRRNPRWKRTFVGPCSMFLNGGKPSGRSRFAEDWLHKLEITYPVSLGPAPSRLF